MPSAIQIVGNYLCNKCLKGLDAYLLLGVGSQPDYKDIAPFIVMLDKSCIETEQSWCK